MSKVTVAGRCCDDGSVRELVVEYRKWPRSLHYRTTMTLLGIDGAGLWAGSRGGALAQRGDGSLAASSADAVTLFPVDLGWTARWYSARAASGRASRFRCYTDITTPVSRTQSGLHVVDLDLDVAETWDGEVLALDEDEFACNQVALGYPELVVMQAVEAFAEVKQAMAAKSFPFDGTADRYMSCWSRFLRGDGTVASGRSAVSTARSR